MWKLFQWNFTNQIAIIPNLENIAINCPPRFIFFYLHSFFPVHTSYSRSCCALLVSILGKLHHQISGIVLSGSRNHLTPKDNLFSSIYFLSPSDISSHSDNRTNPKGFCPVRPINDTGQNPDCPLIVRFVRFCINHCFIRRN